MASARPAALDAPALSTDQLGVRVRGRLAAAGASAGEGSASISTPAADAGGDEPLHQRRRCPPIATKTFEGGLNSPRN